MLNFQVIKLISFLCVCCLSFIGELLLEWLTLNCDGRNPTTQAFLQQLKSCIHSNSNTNSKDNDLKEVN